MSVLEHLTRIDEVRVGDAVLGHQGIHRNAKVLGDGGEVVSSLHRIGAGGLRGCRRTASDGQDLSGVDDVRIARTIARDLRGGDTELRRDAGEGVAGLHGVGLRGGSRSLCSTADGQHLALVDQVRVAGGVASDVVDRDAEARSDGGQAVARLDCVLDATGVGGLGHAEALVHDGLNSVVAGAERGLPLVPVTVLATKHSICKLLIRVSCKGVGRDGRLRISGCTLAGIGVPGIDVAIELVDVQAAVPAIQATVGGVLAAGAAICALVPGGVLVAGGVHRGVLGHPCSAVVVLGNCPREHGRGCIYPRLDTGSLDDLLDEGVKVAGVAPCCVLVALPVDDEDALADPVEDRVDEEVRLSDCIATRHIMVDTKWLVQ